MSWRSTALALPLLCGAVCLGHLYARELERRSVGWLMVFFACATVTVIPQIIGFAGAYDRWPDLTFAPLDLAMWFGPTLYLHAHSLVHRKPPPWHWWLFAPGAAYVLYQSWAFLLLPDVPTKWAFNDAVHEPYVLPMVFLGALALVIFALVQIWRLRRSYLRWLADHHSDGDRFEPRWLLRFVLVGTPLAVVWALEYVLGSAFGLDYFERYWGNFAAVVLLFLLCSEALARIDAQFPKIDTKQASAPPTSEETRDWQAEGERLREAALAQGWHLQAGLSLQRLSRLFGMNQSYLSRTLNQGLEQTFSQFVNGLRVEHAKSLLSNPNLSLLEIAHDSGFGSKASFNRAFREHAGTTPSQMRQELTSQRSETRPNTG